MVSPEELSADGAEGGLAEERGNELVVFDAVNLLLLNGSSPPVESHNAFWRRSLSGRLACHRGGNVNIYIKSQD